MNAFSLPLHWLLPGTLLFSVGMIALLARFARTLGWEDHPGTRKHHRHPVPLVGGVVMSAGFGLSVLLLPEKPHYWQLLLTSMTVVTLVGLYDDLHSSRPVTRFMYQAGAVALMALGSDIVLGNLGDLFGFGPVVLGWWAVLFTLFGVVGVINAFNMIDGLDGLAGGTALVVAGWLLVLCLSTPSSHAGDLGALLALTTVIIAFLAFNLRHPGRTHASVFMGDAGSTMLGFVLSWFSVHLSTGEAAVMAPITAVWLLALPLMDTVAVMVRRIMAGRNPFAADRQHLHHLLLARGLTDGRVTALILALTFVTGGLGVLANGLEVPHYVQFYSFGAAFLVYFRLTTAILRRRPAAPPGADLERRRPPPDADDADQAMRVSGCDPF